MSDSQYALYLFTSFPPSAPSSRYLTPDQSTSITLCVVGVSVTFSVVVSASVAFSGGAAVGEVFNSGSGDYIVSVKAVKNGKTSAATSISYTYEDGSVTETTKSQETLHLLD